MVARIIFGFIGLGVGFVLVWKADWFMVNFGRISWAEQHFSMYGGSRFFYKMLGILIIFLSFLLMTGLVQVILRGIFVRTISL